LLATSLLNNLSAGICQATCLWQNIPRLHFSSLWWQIKPGLWSRNSNFRLQLQAPRIIGYSSGI